jgi:hypothetical protein
MLAPRFRADGRATIALSPTQLAARDAVAGRIRAREYELVHAACAFCGGDEPIEIAAKDMYGLPMDVAVCGACGGVYTRTRLGDEALGRFYDGEYRALDRGAPIEESGYFELQRAKGARIAAFLRNAGALPPAGGLVVEIGCGAGGILDACRELGHPVFGVDLGSEYVQWGAANHGLDLRVGDLRTAIGELGERRQRPALVIYEQVLEHRPDPAAELRALADLMEVEVITV